MPKPDKKQPPPPATAQISVEARSETPWYYANYIGVSHSAYDFTLSAVKVPSPFTAEQLQIAQRGEKIPLEPVLQLVVPPLLIDGLIFALKDQKEKYEKTLAQQVKNNDTQHKHLEVPDSVH